MTRTAAKAETPPWATALDWFDAHLVELERSNHTRANYREEPRPSPSGTKRNITTHRH